MTDLARNPKQLGNVIRTARRRRGWNQTLLAEKAGVGQDTISLVEGGNSAARIDTILSILAVLGLELRVAPRSKSDAAAIEDIF